MQFGMCENWTEDCVFVQSKTLNEASAWSVRSMLNFQFWRRFVSTISCASPERWLALQNADWPTSHNAIARSVLHIEIYQRLTNDEKCIKLRPVQLLLHFFQKPKKIKIIWLLPVFDTSESLQRPDPFFSSDVADEVHNCSLWNKTNELSSSTVRVASASFCFLNVLVAKVRTTCPSEQDIVGHCPEECKLACRTSEHKLERLAKLLQIYNCFWIHVSLAIV